uniref:Probable alginate O-acetylase AlgI n=1 Tax=Rhodopseudomonas palustris (strain BisA53) TaxID=316055 RepID=Q07SL6_RHOP5
MLFNSFPFFFVFLPCTLAAYFLISYDKRSFAIPTLVAASLIFYSYWNWRFTPLLIASIILNYSFGRALAFYNRSDRRRLVLSIGVTINILLLFYFKYLDWFIDVFATLFGVDFGTFGYPLPLGISFFTFTQIAYLVDTYHKKVSERSFSHFLLFVTYFPHLIAGPILHHAEMMPQFSSVSNKRISWHNISLGLFLFLIGAIKKVGFADTLAPFADRVFDGTHQLSAADAWAGALAYTGQIYYDFSGYTDMALGLSRMFNISLPLNFNSPYKAKSIIDFWRRWHMTLSRFLRDYLYISLGGNRRGSTRRYLNLFITMLLGGIWHGAGWTFLIWGALHGSYLIVNHAVRAIRRRFNWDRRCLADHLAQPLTFLAVVVAWVFFRATDLESALRIVQAMIGLGTINAIQFIPEFPDGLIGWVGDAHWLWISTLLVLAFLCPNSQQITDWIEAIVDRMDIPGIYKQRLQFLFLGFMVSTIAFVISVSGMRNGASPFIYFNF